MAKGSVVVGKVKGSAGNLNFRVNKGQQIMAAKAVNVGNPKTRAQMMQRMRWKNYVKLYKLTRKTLKDSFENKDGRKTDYNMFMKSNLSRKSVFLTKEEANLGACVASACQISEGSLNKIEITQVDQTAISSIALGDLVISDTTTVGDLTVAILANNADWMSLDQVNFFNFEQRFNTQDNYPYVVFSHAHVILSATDKTLLKAIVGKHGFASKDGYLAYGGDLEQGAFAWLQSRKSDNSKTEVSPQTLFLHNDLFDYYSSKEQFTKAAVSYGGISEIYLRPDVDEFFDSSDEQPSQGTTQPPTGGNGTSGGTPVTPPAGGGDNGLGE